MDIVLHCLGLPFNGETIYTSSLGGSESAGYYLARALAKRGHHVRVFTATEKEGSWDGVEYLSAGLSTQATPYGAKFHRWASTTPHDALIVQRQPQAFNYQWASKVNVLQLHDLALLRQVNEVGNALWNISAVTCVSNFHADQVAGVYPIPRDRLDVVRNGIDLDLYECAPFEGIVRETDAFKMLYQSRPERGLEHLVRPGGIMDRLRDTSAMLYVCAYECTLPHMQGLYAQLDAWCEALPNVVKLGALSKPQLAAVQKACDLMVYPTEFEEVSCITAMEAMAAGLPLLTTNAGALPETCLGTGTMHISLTNGKADEDAFVQQLQVYCADAHAGRSILLAQRAMQDLAKFQITWGHAATDLERLIERELMKRCKSPTAVLKTAIELADIDTAEDIILPRVGDNREAVVSEALLPGVEANAIFDRASKEVRTLYNFRFTPEAYVEHYKHHQGVYYDAHEEQVIGEDVTHTSRFRATVSAMNAKMVPAKASGLRILDYGCAHGHYIMPLAKAAPKCEFTGVDISGRAIGAALKWAARDGIGNVTLVHGGEEALHPDMLCPYTPPESGREIDMETGREVRALENYERFDIILAGEVVEHVWDYRALIEKFRALLKPDGLLIITTPFGRWEWWGHDAFKTGREHVHHFEKQDLRELFDGHDVEITCAAVGGDDCGLVVGSWVTAVQFAPGVPLGTIDAQRKARQFAARETVSACLIVKDGETSLRAALNSVAYYVDEVVIGIDRNTKDGTEDVIEAFRQANPWLPVLTLGIDSPMDVGFDEARNAVHFAACGDWILWFDADEVVIDAKGLHKYLKPSLINGVHFPQVHYSAQPAEVLTTDHPCRLYRNDGTMRIYGVVHEHVEYEPGKGVKQAIMRDDVQFAHSGYVTEEVRRKRYGRNMPLLMRDVEKYPTRTLNKFLFIRDLAQGIVFSAQQNGGFTQNDMAAAHKGVGLFRELVDSDHPAVSRLLLDALQYYSVCVEALGAGFEAEVNFKLTNPPMQAASAVKGRFLNREHFTTLVDRLFKEATKHYEAKYF